MNETTKPSLVRAPLGPESGTPSLVRARACRCAAALGQSLGLGLALGVGTVPAGAERVPQGPGLIRSVAPVPVALLPDLVVTAASVTPVVFGCWSETAEATFTYTVRNQGRYRAAGFLAGVRITGLRGVVTFAEPRTETFLQGFQGLMPGQEVTCTQRVLLRSGAVHQPAFSVVIDPDHAVVESDEANNTTQGGPIPILNTRDCGFLPVDPMW